MTLGVQEATLKYRDDLDVQEITLEVQVMSLKYNVFVVFVLNPLGVPVGVEWGEWSVGLFVAALL